jgi:glycosyltransferase involved in cell wall biosynthesis
MEKGEARVIDRLEPKADREEEAAASVSVIVPIAERHDDIRDIHREYKAVLSAADRDIEMIYVIDGGGFLRAYEELKRLKGEGENLAIVRLSQSFGEAAAIMTGFHHARGDLILILPAYRQVEPDQLRKLFEEIPGHDFVAARRWPRTDSRWNRYQTRMFHWFLRLLTRNMFQDIGCGVRLVKRSVLEEITLYGDLHRFLPILAAKQGFNGVEVDLAQSGLERPVRTYSPGVYLRRMIDLMTVFFLVKFTKKPLRFFGLTGSAVMGAGFVITAYLVVSRLAFASPLSDRPLFLLGILFLVLGIQIFAIGLIGEIIIFTHARDFKEYHVEEIIN